MDSWSASWLCVMRHDSSVGTWLIHGQKADRIGAEPDTFPFPNNGNDPNGPKRHTTTDLISRGD